MSQPQYLPIYALERPVPVGIAGVVLGSIACLCVVGAFYVLILALPAIVLSLIGVPLSAVALGRRARRRMPFATAGVGLALNLLPLGLLALTIVIVIARM